MTASKPFLILQLRPEDDTSDSEFEAILKYGELDVANTRRLRIEKSGIPELSLDDYAAVIVGGSPFDISTPEHEKTPIQVKIEADFRRLFDDVVSKDTPFLGACSGCGLLGSYLDTPISRKYGEPVGGTVVQLTEDGRNDALLEGFPEQIAVLCGHKEACDTVPRKPAIRCRAAPPCCSATMPARCRCFASVKTSMRHSFTRKETARVLR